MKKIIIIPHFKWVLGLLILGFVMVMSCSKSSTSTPSDSVFLGKFAGNMVDGYLSSKDTITITAGSTSDAIVMNTRTSTPSVYTVYGTVSGNSLTISAQSVYISSYGSNYTVSGTGSISNGTLTIHYVFVSPANSTSNWTYTGARQS